MMRWSIGILIALIAGPLWAAPQQPVRVAKSGTHLETTDGKPFFFLADTCWTGPALSTEADWAKYLADRKAKGFTAIQFNLVSPWRTAPTDIEGRTSYTITDGKLTINDAFYDQAEARMKAIVEAGLLPVPVLIWANSKLDPGTFLPEPQIIQILQYELDRFKGYPALWVLAGDTNYTGPNGEKWKRIGRAVTAGREGLLMTTHPTGENYPWDGHGWPDESWLTVLGYQSGHGDSTKTLQWLVNGPVTKTTTTKKPIINLEPPYEGHNGYASRKPHTAFSTRRATYWSLLVSPVAGVTYGGHGVWSWHTRPGEEPTGHKGTGMAKPWHEAIALPFTDQLDTLRDTFERLPWTELRPAQRLLDRQPGEGDPKQFVAVAATPDASAFIVYCPVGVDGLRAVKPRVLAVAKLTLVNPVTGVRTPTTAETLLADAARAVSVDGDVILVGGGKQ